MLVLRDLRAAYDGREILHGVELRVAGGDIVQIAGRNGAGKSTLLRAIAGLVPTRADALSLDDLSIGNLTPEQRFERGVCFMPQGHRVFPSLSVGENIALAVRNRGKGPWDIDTLRSRFGMLEERFDQRAGTLSGGETQIVLLARALVGNPRVLLLDEPTEGLDPRALASMVGLIAECAERGTAVIVTDQQTDALSALASVRYELRDGFLG